MTAPEPLDCRIVWVPRVQKRIDRLIRLGTTRRDAVRAALSAGGMK